MATLTVGAGSQYQYQTIASAVAASQNGDVILVAAGTYTNDFLDFSDSITLKAVGGMVIINATVPPPDAKAIITEGATGANVTISGFELTGAAVSAADGSNGAGIRYQGGNLTLTNDYIYNNQDGIMGNPAVAGTGTITISNSEFANNGDGSGSTHNIYIGNVATLNITHSLITGAVVGHEIKSRALNTIITNNVIADGPTGTASYSIDLPNGGNATITGDVIEQGPESQNPAIIAYGEEGATNPGTSVTISSNTILNDLNSSSASAVWNTTTTNITFNNNHVYGLTTAQLINGTATASKTTILTKEPTVNMSPPWSAAATLPGVTAVSVTPASGNVGVKQTVTFTLTFNEAVKVVGTPKLTLNDGGTASYMSGSGTTRLVFKYTVAAGQSTSDLTLTGSALPTGASIKDAAGNNASLLGVLANPQTHLIVGTAGTPATITSGASPTVAAGASSELVARPAASTTLNAQAGNAQAGRGFGFLRDDSGSASATMNDTSPGVIGAALNGDAGRFSFPPDPTAVADLLGGVGGSAGVAAAWHALTSDGNGGAWPSPGSDRSIDFAGVPPVSMTAASF